MKEIYSDCLKSVKDKLGSPLYCYIAAAWLVYNWKPLSIFFLSDENIHARLRYVSTYADEWTQLWHPLIYGIGFALLYPVANKAYEFLEIVTSSIVRSKDNAQKIVFNWFERKKQEAEFKSENLQKTKQAEFDLKIAETEKQRAEAEYDTRLAEANIKSLEEAKTKIDKLTEERDKAIFENYEIKERTSNLETFSNDVTNQRDAAQQQINQLANFLKTCRYELKARNSMPENNELLRKIDNMLRNMNLEP